MSNGDYLKEMGNKIRVARQSNNISLRKLGALCKTDMSNLCHIEKTPFLAGSTQLPNAPHLIIVPGGLLPQWYSCLMGWLTQGSCDILMYGSGPKAQAEFWDKEKGPYFSSKYGQTQQHYRIIILATKEVE